MAPNEVGSSQGRHITRQSCRRSAARLISNAPHAEISTSSRQHFQHYRRSIARLARGAVPPRRTLNEREIFSQRDQEIRRQEFLVGAAARETTTSFRSGLPAAAHRWRAREFFTRRSEDQKIRGRARDSWLALPPARPQRRSVPYTRASSLTPDLKRPCGRAEGGEPQKLSRLPLASRSPNLFVKISGPSRHLRGLARDPKRRHRRAEGGEPNDSRLLIF
jgi:hypothetical protein